jgi:hypothetical protein
MQAKVEKSLRVEDFIIAKVNHTVYRHYNNENS